jgi:opacity protein-like surface antigen
MKTIIITIVIFLFHLHAFAQTDVTLSGGYVFGKVENGPDVSGYKISVAYEQVLMNEHWAMGASLSYIAVTESEGIIDTRFRALPALFIPKYLVGQGKLKGYAKGALGLQSSRFKFDGAILETEDWDFGIVFGGGLGANYTLNEKLFLNLDYEYLWIKNSAYNDVGSNAITFGIGFIIPD